MSTRDQPEKLQEVLRSAAQSMFPAEDDDGSVDVNSRSPDGDTPLHVFAWRGDVASARVLVEASADVNAAGDMGETPLHVALNQQNEALVRLFVEAGARTTIRSEFGETAQDIAQRVGGIFAKLVPVHRGERRNRR